METKEFSLKDKLTFGKHRGLTIQEIIDDDPNYLEWAIDEIEWFDLDGETSKKLEFKLGENDHHLDDFPWSFDQW